MKRRVESAKKLAQSLTQKGLVNRGVQAGAVGEEGLGLFASQKLQGGRPALVVPESCWRPLSADVAWERLNAEVPKLCDDLVDFAKARDVSKRSQVMLVGSVSFLLHLLLELELDESSMKDHLDTIPKTIQVPLFWTNDKLEQLQASPVLDKILEQRNIIHAIYTAVVGPHIGHKISPSNFSFAWALTLSRAISDSSNQMPFCIPPYFDLFNHQNTTSSPGYCHHYFDNDSSSFLVVPSRDVEPGQELFISYGLLNNADLLRKYGFCLEKNPNDYILFTSPLASNVRVRCSLSGDVTVERLDDTTQVSNSDLLNCLKAKLEQYETSVAEDRALLSTPQVLGNLDLRHAILVRAGEKTSLLAGIERLRSMT